MTTLWQDVRYALRMLVRSPGFTAVALLTLALGIGLNATIFSVVNAVLLRPLPFREPQRLVHLRQENQQLGSGQVGLLGIPYATYLDWREQNQVFDDIGIYRTSALTVTGGAQAEQVRGAQVSANLFALLGVPPVLGRDFLAREDQPGAQRVILLSHSLWQRRFGGDPEILGRAVTLDDRVYTVVGVMPAGFRFPALEEVWTPLIVESPQTERGNHWYDGIGRLKREVDIQRARGDMTAIAQRLKEAHPETDAGMGVVLSPLHEEMTREPRTILWVLLGAVGFVLAVACANVANLFLVRATGRRREMTLRAALGATRWQMIRQLLTESLVLSLAAGSVGLLLSFWGLDLVLAAVPGTLPYWIQFQLDGRILGYTLGISLLTSLVFGLTPAWHASRLELSDVLKEGSRGGGMGPGSHHLRDLLVVSQVALALLLLAGAGLMLRSFLKLQQVNPGFHTQDILVFHLSLPAAKYAEPAQKASFYRQLLERVAALPGVRSAGAVSALPLGGGTSRCTFQIEGLPAPAPGAAPWANVRVVTPGYFRTMGIPLLQGRDFADMDQAQTAPVVLIDRMMVQRYFAADDPLGRRLQGGAPWSTIVGVVGDVKHDGLHRGILHGGIYLVHAQVPEAGMTVVVRTEGGDPLSLAPAVQEAVTALDRDLPLAGVSSMEEVVRRSFWAQRFFSQLLGIFSLLALLLAVVGIYGVMAYLVAQRTHEIGVRMALGARRADVVRFMVRRGMVPVGLGLVLGLAGTLALTRLLAGQLYGIAPNDPATLGGVSAVLTVASLLASYLPARRAARVDPMVALRHD